MEGGGRGEKMEGGGGEEKGNEKKNKNMMWNATSGCGDLVIEI